MADTVNDSAPRLRRTLGLLAITAFGVGDILGAGVYGLIGKVAGLVGHAAWMSYVLAGVMAALTGLVYAEWTSRCPRAGGAAHFCEIAFRQPLLTFLVIVFVTLSGLFSMAATSRIFADYALAECSQAPAWLRQWGAPGLFILLLSAFGLRGIRLSSAVNAVCTLVEVSGLFAILVIGVRFLGRVDYLAFAPAPPNATALGATVWPVIGGASLAFFAFVGFEDLANLSEEVHDPERNVPLAICLSILITGAIYCAIALVAVSVLPPSVLGASRSPLLDVVRTAAPRFPAWIYTVIPGFAVFNTGLLNLLMASRLLYGMSRSRSRLLPAAFGYIHPRWQTPVVGLTVSTGIVLALLVAFPDVKRLTSGTSSFLLAVFVLLHLGLIRVKLRAASPAPRFRVPLFVPALGAATGVLLLFRQDPAALRAAAAVGVAALIGYLGIRLARGGRVEVEAID